ncbi:PREDICTED: centrosomal protein of 120 kDa-like isoform X2 [Priapulus caudatus]|uniref:Centrosomal protein of 120 kDa-like isoform X2 n=1 Tax=Priapulus caudatus TaxID=37621 RepID=A0ABM1EH53_PRICU|nr:PREDICTED: centrosomal protein of 120 kDa-like isoform X2 [Priapulus caudatus]
MGSDKAILLIVQLYRGRDFPRRPQHDIVIAAKFNGEEMRTDPIAHGEQPQNDSELGWQLTTRDLHKHKLQRTPIRVKCYAINRKTKTQDQIGYIVLDIRSAENKQQVPKWHQLLNGKYRNKKPALLVAVTVEDDTLVPQGKTPTHNTQVKNTRGAEGWTSFRNSLGGKGVGSQKSPAQLLPVLREADGFYQLGPEQSDNELFTLSVTIAFAANLAQLVPSTYRLPNKGGFFFYYTLLGNNVMSDAFADLLDPTFPAERSSVRVSSNLATLAAFLHNGTPLQIHLCSDDHSLGYAEVSMRSLIPEHEETYSQPYVLEGLFQLKAPGHIQEKLPDLPDDHAPCLGMAIVLRKDANKQDSTLASPCHPSETIRVPHTPPVRDGSSHRDGHTVLPATQQPVKKKRGRGSHTDSEVSSIASYHEPGREAVATTKYRKDEAWLEATLETRPVAAPGPREGQYHAQATSSGAPATSSGAPATSSGVPATFNGAPATSSGAPATFNGAPATSSGAPATSLSTTSTHEVAPPMQHHFRCCIDLRELRAAGMSSREQCYIRYQYPFFGGAAPVMTHPTIEIRPGASIKLPNSFCAFDFATSPQHLQRSLHGSPVILELWSRDQQHKDTLLAHGMLPLGNVLQQACKQTRVAGGKESSQQSMDVIVPIQSTASPGRQLADLDTHVTLEDFGQLATGQMQEIRKKHQEAKQQPETSEQPVAASEPAKPLPPPQPRPSAATLAPGPRASSEYQAALELELWKEAQERLFQHDLQQRESTLLQTLTSEWKKREEERELLLQKKVAEYSDMERKLRAIIAEMGRKEKQIAAREQQLSRLQEECERDKNTQVDKSLTQLRQVQEECRHQLELERSKVKELEMQKQRLREEVAEWERRYKVKAEQFLLYKEEEKSKPHTQLQSQVDLLSLEKADIEKRLESVTKSKVHYKQQWGKALKELARFRHRDQQQARAELDRQQEELDGLRLRYLAGEENMKIDSERHALQDIKQEIARCVLGSGCNTDLHMSG